MNSLGRHILVEFLGCCPETLNDVSIIEKGMVEAAEKAGATVINSTFHHFSPYGVSGVVVIQESHLAIHTWPEYQYAAVDLFTCGDTVEPWISFDHLKQVFKATNHSALEMYRGNINLLNRTELQQTEVNRNIKPKAKFSRTLWFTDRDENQALSLRYLGDCLFNQRSPYQTVRVFETSAYGKMLTIDNCIMATERDEMHYHEMLVHPCMQLHHGSPQNVLVIGGGDGGTIREIFKYPSVEKVTMVEIDELVIKASKEFFPKLAREFNNPKLRLIVGDGIEFIKKAEPESYDVIIVDGADPVGPAEGLFSEEFYRNCYRALKSNGLISAQGESPMFHESAFVALHQRLKKIFGAQSAHVALFFAPTYPSGMWSIQIAQKGPLNPIKDLNVEKTSQFLKSNPLHYYNIDVHYGAFSLPNFVQQMLKGTM
ncbi:MAG: polyamine aminopropyltransferase [Pseudobdellovibrionaceae bacterium]|nr:polyamine aminopropyltransferase [Pseudobdellovibrionaceae bacterium]